MQLIYICLFGYLIGSVPFAFIIGKLFYHTDVRQHGSGNLGGSNTGRVLGKKAGLAVMTLDILKVTLVVFVANVLCGSVLAVSSAAVSAAIGHCYPVFAKFHGGKAVATMYGFLFGLWVCLGYSPLTFFLPLVTFMAVLFLFKIVSLSSMVSSIAAALYIWLCGKPLPVVLAVLVFALLIIVRHSSNIRRMIAGNERKVKWIK